MEANQVYSFINAVQKEALGEQAITVKDTGSLVSLGEIVLSSETNTDAFYQKLADRIGKTYVKARKYIRKPSNMQKTPLEFGAILQKVQTFKTAKAKANTSWTNQANPYATEKDTTDLVQALFAKRGVWEIDTKIIYDYQLQDAFLNAAAMSAFVNLIFNDMYNAMELEIENCEKLTRCTAIAQAFKGTNANIRRNLLAEYNAIAATATTAAKCMYDAGFLKFASMEINKVVKRFPEMTSLFNSAGADRFTPTNDIVVEVLGDFASATASYLEADTYHKDLISLPRYTEITSWQASGVGFAFADVSKIHITDESDTTIEKSGILAFVRDVDTCGVMIDRVRTKSQYNAASELTNYYHKADWGAYVANDENGVVFYVEDAVEDEEDVTA